MVDGGLVDDMLSAIASCGEVAVRDYGEAISELIAEEGVVPVVTVTKTIMHPDEPFGVKVSVRIEPVFDGFGLVPVTAPDDKPLAPASTEEMVPA